jgi:hypothetical protein
VVQKFQEMIPDDSTAYYMNEYNLSTLTIPVDAVFGEQDSRCPALTNMNMYSPIPSLFTDIAFGYGNDDLIANN